MKGKDQMKASKHVKKRIRLQRERWEDLRLYPEMNCMTIWKLQKAKEKFTELPKPEIEQQKISLTLNK